MRVATVLLATSLFCGVAVAQPPQDHPRAEQLADREAEILEWVSDQDAERHAKLVRLKEADPERYRQALRRAHRMMRMVEVDPGALERRDRQREIRRELQTLGEGVDSLEKREQKTRRARVEELVAEGFELRLESAEARIAMQEARLAEAREKLQNARDERDERIDEHVEKVLSGELSGPRGAR